MFPIQSSLKKITYLSQQQWYDLQNTEGLDADTVYITPTDNYGGVIGQRGEKGAQGEKGDKGDTGPQGIQGEAAFGMEIASVETLLPGQAAYMMNLGTTALQRYAVGIPTGPRGVQGIPGERGVPGKDGGGMVEWDNLVIRSDGFCVTVSGDVYNFSTEYDESGRITAISDGERRRTIVYE